MSPHCRFSDLGLFRLRIFFRTSGESNPRPWRWIKPTKDQHVKCNERRTRPCHRAYYIRGSTPFHLCVEVQSPKLLSSEDQTGARAPSASNCSAEGVAPLHTAPPVPVCATSAGKTTLSLIPTRLHLIHTGLHLIHNYVTSNPHLPSPPLSMRCDKLHVHRHSDTLIHGKAWNPLQFNLPGSIFK